MAPSRTRKGRSPARTVRTLATRPPAAAKVRGGAPKSKRPSAVIYVEQVKLTLKESDA